MSDEGLKPRVLPVQAVPGPVGVFPVGSMVELNSGLFGLALTAARSNCSGTRLFDIGFDD